MKRFLSVIGKLALAIAIRTFVEIINEMFGKNKSQRSKSQPKSA
jgi:hypothetical protein